MIWRRQHRHSIVSGSTKKANEDSEELVLTWITEQRQKGARVSRNVIQTKAKRIFHTEIVEASKKEETFEESACWLDKFMKRYQLSLRRKTMLAYWIQNKHVSFVMWVSNKRTADGMEGGIIAMDETSAWFDMPGPTTAEPTGSRSVTTKTRGHKKSHFTMTLAAKADGTKFKPFIVFRGA